MQGAIAETRSKELGKDLRTKAKAKARKDTIFRI
jgi:hypothetical protein